MRVPKRRGQDEPGKGDVTDFHLTPKAIAGLRDELERLEKRVRPKAVEELRRTREMGDLSENFAYTAAKGRLIALDGRILSIKERLKRAIAIESGPDSDGSARIGSTVVVEVSGKQKTFEITGAQESDPSAGRISHLSPVGKALLGKKPGETASLEVNGKTVEYRVLEVR